MSDEDLRERILDAAQECLLEAGLTARLHSAIAARAGISRPTVYKYVGDQQAITDALLDREIGRFLAALYDVAVRPGEPREQFVESVAFAIAYGRNHELLQKMLREEPQLALPPFTTHAEPTLRRVIAFGVPLVEDVLRQQGVTDVDPKVVMEWGARIVLSLVTTPSVTVNLDDPRALRDFIRALLNIGRTG
jgi:AcrR family transcriptional regulator